MRSSFSGLSLCFSHSARPIRIVSTSSSFTDFRPQLCRARSVSHSAHRGSPRPKTRVEMATDSLRFIEIAANLTDDMFMGKYNGRDVHVPDMDSVLHRAREAGVVRTMVTAGTELQSQEALDLANAHPDLYSTAGIHPTRSRQVTGRIEDCMSNLKSIIAGGGTKIVAVGECGLDYDRLKFSSKEEQMPVFLAHFELAEATGLPMFLHDRNTSGDFANVIKENRSRFSTGVVHSFTGTLTDMREYLEQNLYIGLNGCSLKTPENLDVAIAVPLDRLMLETDCPYCGIRRSHAGFEAITSTWPAKDKAKWTAETCVKGRSEPCHIRQVCEVLASIRGESPDVIARAAYNNTMSVFFPKDTASEYSYDGVSTENAPAGAAKAQ